MGLAREWESNLAELGSMNGNEHWEQVRVGFKETFPLISTSNSLAGLRTALGEVCWGGEREEEEGGKDERGLSGKESERRERM